uniref:DAGKc domain-containing protein n=1 Tax=Sus scrofa TaxID=9823 RepID=A0A8D1YVV3_PIG
MAPPPPLPLTASTPLLHGEFGSYPARGPRFALTLTPQALHIQRLRPKPEARPRGGLVLLAEVSGCCTLRSRSPSDSAAYFCIYTYPRGRRGGRRRAARTFRADEAATYEENRAEAQRWATALTCLLRGLPLPGDGDITPDLLPRPPRLLLLVNPFGGRGLAWQWCKNHVLPMISEAGLSFNLIQTERQNHARELVQGLSLSEWDGIVTVSGDGLLYEVGQEHPASSPSPGGLRRPGPTPGCPVSRPPGAEWTPRSPRLGRGCEDPSGHPALWLWQRTGRSCEPAWGVGGRGPPGTTGTASHLPLGQSSPVHHAGWVLPTPLPDILTCLVPSCLSNA